MTYLTATSLSKILLNLAFSRQDEKGSLPDGKSAPMSIVAENLKQTTNKQQALNKISKIVQLSFSHGARSKCVGMQTSFILKKGQEMFNRIGILTILGLMCFVTSQAQNIEQHKTLAEVSTVQPIAESTTKPFYMALKTNALMDAIAIPNVGLELYVGKRWSVATNWHYAWWKTDSKSWYWRTYGGDIALRRWLGRKASEKPLTGHHVGVYGQILTYDIETGGRGYLGDRWSYAAGVEYGYSIPIAKRMNIDFTLGLGYLSGEYKEYLPMDECYVWQATKNRHWMGPTKAEMSLVWLIGHGNKNKGGKR